MIKNIIFDMGKVLIHWNPRDFIRPFNLTEPEMVQLEREVFQNVEWLQMDRGILEPQAAVQPIILRLPEKLHEPAKTLVLSWHKRYLKPMEGMAELIQELKQNGYGIYLLSNANQFVRVYFSNIPGSEYFDGLMFSFEEHHLKPEHEIYERLYERFALKPEECWFIDDTNVNIEAALLTGMRGTIFRGDTKQLRRELQNAGIQISE